MRARLAQLRGVIGGRPVQSGPGLPRDAKLLGVAIFFAIAGTNVLTPLLPDITQDLQISYSAAGFLVTSYIFARLVASVLVGWFENRIGRIAVAAAGVAALAGGSAIGLVSTNVEMLLVSRLISGAGIGFIATVALTALGDLAPARNRGQVMSLFQVAHSAGIALYPIVGGILGALVGWRSTFLVMIAGAMLSAWFLLPVLARLRTSGPADRADAPEAAYVAMSPRRRATSLGAVYVGVFAAMFNRHGFRNTLMPLYAGTVLGLGSIAISTGVTAMSLVGLVIAMPGAMAGDRFGHRRMIAGGLFALALGDLAFLLTGNYLSFLIASTALGLGDFFIGSQTALLASMAPTGQRTQVLGGFRIATDAGALAGPIALATLMDLVGPQTAMVAAAAVLMLAAIVARIGIPSRPVPPPHVRREDLEPGASRP